MSLVGWNLCREKGALKFLGLLVLYSIGQSSLGQAEGLGISPPQLEASQIIVMDASTGTVLFEREPHQVMGPSSMTKIMTAYMVFEKLKKGLVSLEDLLPISERAWRMQGSKMFVSVKSTVSIGDLLRGMIVVSGNDACVALAEGLWGTEERLAELMTAKAKELGAQHTVFKNSSGWPDPQHVSTAYDLAQISIRLIKDFPEYYFMFSEKDFTYHEIHQMNRNPLLYADISADGIKTGQTEAAGFGLVGSAVNQGFRVLLVINGLKSASQRAREAETIVRWVFREFESLKMFNKNEPIDAVSVWGGAEDLVPVAPAEDICLTLPKGRSDRVKVELVYQGPVSAPIQKGQQVAQVWIQWLDHPEKAPWVFPLFAQKDVEEASFFRKVPAMLRYLLWGTAHKKEAA